MPAGASVDNEVPSENKQQEDDSILQKTFTWEDVQEHSRLGDSCIVVERGVYDISKWSYRHPGGIKVIQTYAGSDATDPFRAFHPNPDFVQKYLRKLQIGQLSNTAKQVDPLISDFRELRREVEEKGFLKANPWFYLAHFAHIIALEFLALAILYYFGNSWSTWLLAAVIMTCSQNQAGWLQHDFGHLTVVFQNSFWNHFIHHFLMEFLKGTSSSWWNHRHFLHHAKPNTIKKDPDVNYPWLFLFGNYVAEIWGKRRRGFMPYQFQHLYWFIFGPPIVIPIYFHVEIMTWVFLRRKYIDFILMVAYVFKMHFLFSPLLGSFGAVLRFYFFIRFLESHWFLWVTQMSHLPMPIEHEKNQDWVTHQVTTTCNVEPGNFNDWFTGHLNYQIEHHLFPTMPRHNFYKVAPAVAKLCKKHDLKICEKTLYRAFADIYETLKHSGDVWYNAYYEG